MVDNIISTLQLERYLLGELSDKDRLFVEQSLRNNPELQKQLKKMEDSNQEILSKYSPSNMSRKIMARYEEAEEQKKSSVVPGFIGLLRRRTAWVVSGAAIAAALLFVVIPNLSRFQSPEIVYEKGLTPFINIYMKSGNNTTLLSNYSKAKQNDVLQISYIAANRGYGMIFSIDGRGNVTLHYPEKEDSSTQLIPTNEVFLPAAYQLDDAPRFERFIFVTAGVKLPLGQILNDAQQLAKGPDPMHSGLKLPKGFEQNTVVIQKETK